MIICRACFILADVLLICITWFTISWRSMLDSVGRKDFLSLGEVMLRNGEVSPGGVSVHRIVLSNAAVHRGPQEQHTSCKAIEFLVPFDAGHSHLP